MGNGQEWVNLYGSDGKKKAAFNIRTGELVVKDRGDWHRWNLAAMVATVAETDRLTVEPAVTVC